MATFNLAQPFELNLGSREKRLRGSAVSKAQSNSLSTRNLCFQSVIDPVIGISGIVYFNYYNLECELISMDKAEKRLVKTSTGDLGWEEDYGSGEFFKVYFRQFQSDADTYIIIHRIESRDHGGDVDETISYFRVS